MRRVIACALALASAGAWAQEIGKELPANPTSPPPPPPPAAESPASAAPARGTASAPASGPKFGLTATFNGGALAAAPVAIAGVPPSAGGASPEIGLKFFATDSVAIDVNAGVQIISQSSGTSFGFGAGAGVDFYFGAPGAALRPFITGGADFGKGVSQQGNDFALTFDVGAGAEYWLSEHFSLNGRAVILMPLALGNSTTISLGTVSPAIGATFYF